MSLLNSASLCVTPNAYKEGTLYSVIPNTTLGDMTVVRATTATRVNSAGLIELVPYNLVTYSEQFDNAVYAKINTTINANNTTAPDGTLTADKFVETAVSGFHYWERLQTFSASDTISIFAKAGERSQIGIGNAVAGASIFDLSNGTLISSGGSLINNEQIENYGNGWYRISANLIYAGAFSAQVFIANGGSLNYVGNGTSGLYIWGFQLVEGALPKDYLRTETRLNIPRLDYSNGSCPSLLVEPQRTNLLTYSEQFDNAAWGAPANVIANTVVSPDGTTTGDTLTGGLYRLQVFSATTYVFSFYAKKNAQSTFSMRVDAPTNQTFNFNLDTGIADGGCSMVNVGNGWYRCLMPFTSSLAGTGVFYPNVNGNNFYIWGAQLEQATYPTSYIPTTSAAVTRNADVISKTGISSLIGQTEGTMFFDIYRPTLNAPFFYIIANSVGINNYLNSIFIYQNANGNIRTECLVSGVQQALISTSGVSVGRHKIAVAYKQNDFVLYIDGNLIGTDTSGNIPPLSAIEINGTDAGSISNMNINSAILFPTRLTNAELASLTT